MWQPSGPCYTIRMHSWAKQKAFTIVELLIVIIVIAILAAITIVAYTGIQGRAKESALSAVATQAGRQLLAYAPLNLDMYPMESQFADPNFRATTLNLPVDSPERVYDYYVSDNQKAFCLSVTDTTASPEVARAFTQAGQEVAGRCVKNLAPNPSFESSLGSWTTSGAASQSRTSGGAHGDWGLSVTRTTSGDPYASLHIGGIDLGSDYTVSIWVRGGGSIQTSSGSQLQELYGSYRTMRTLVGPGTIPTPAWTKYSGSFTTPSDLSGSVRYVLRPGLNAGESLSYDAAMLVAGSTEYPYRDGSFADWSWTGVSNNSSSFGPVQPL